MIEIYLFVNPLGEYCFEMEQQLLQFIEEEYGTPSKERCNSLSSFGQFADNWGCHATKGISQNNLEERNHLFSMTYSAALDCKAAQFQGKKRPPF